MKTFKKSLLMGALLTAVAASTAFAATSQTTPAEILAGLTGKTTQNIWQERRESGKSFGTMASESGVLGKFQTENREARQARLNEHVAEGRFTKEEAAKIMADFDKRQADCSKGDCTSQGKRGGMGKNQGLHNNVAKGQGNLVQTKS